VFIAGPVLTLWKEREPLYEARRRRIEDEHGEVPAFAVATKGAPVDVDPSKRPTRRGSITAPQDPTQVSRAEFDDMVANLGVEPERETSSARSTPRTAPVGGRRSRTNGGAAEPGARKVDEGGPADGDGQDAREKRQRNRRHGRPR
jgi:SecD/SecF fusion protein